MPKKINKNAQSLGKLGHKATLKKYGKAAFAAGGSAASKTLLEKYGPDYFKELRKKGTQKKRNKKS